MKSTFGLLLIAFGVLFGLWAGIWWAFIGGIVDVVNAFKAADISAMAVAIGVAKVFFAGLIGWLGGIVPVSIGVSML